MDPLREMGVGLRDIVEATIALAVVWAQLRACRKSLKGQGKRIGALETKVGEMGKVLEFRKGPDVR